MWMSLFRNSLNRLSNGAIFFSTSCDSAISTLNATARYSCRRQFTSETSSPAESTTQSLRELDPLHEGDKFAKVPDRGVILVEGADSVKFLQGLITNHMPKIERGGEGFFAAFLNPQGRVLFDVFIYPRNIGTDFPHPRFFIESSTSIIPSLMGHLKRYKVRSKVNIEDISTDYSIWNIWGPNKSSMWWQKDGGKGLPVGGFLLKKDQIEIGCRDGRMPLMGWRVVTKSNSKPDLPSTFEELPSSEYTIRRMLHGVPEGPLDYFSGSSLPLESNFDYMGGVDFRKGCYVGQELTIRTYHTGVTRKRIVPVQIVGKDEPLPSTFSVDRTKTYQLPSSQNDIISLADSSSRRTKAIGKFCNGIHNVGLALLRLEHLSDADSLKCFVPESMDGNIQLRPHIPAWWPR